MPESLESSWVSLLHGVFGVFGLVVAPLAMLVRKGGAAHRFWGRSFVLSLAVTALCAVALSSEVGDPAMALLAVLSLHLAVSGYRALYLKDLHRGLQPARVDLILHGIPGLVFGGLLIWGVGLGLAGHATSESHIYALAGLLGLGNVFRLFRRFRNPRVDRRQWLFDHMTGFLGAYVVTLTAFCAVGLTQLPVLVRWVVPSVLGVPLILLWARYYRKQFERGRRVRNLADVRIP